MTQTKIGVFHAKNYFPVLLDRKVRKSFGNNFDCFRYNFSQLTYFQDLPWVTRPFLLYELNTVETSGFGNLLLRQDSRLVGTDR